MKFKVGDIITNRTLSIKIKIIGFTKDNYLVKSNDFIFLNGFHRSYTDKHYVKVGSIMYYYFVVLNYIWSKL